MADEPSNQDAQLQIHGREIEARIQDSSNKKEVALLVIETQTKDREQNRKAFERESKRRKIFGTIWLVLIIAFVSFLVMQGYAENVFALFNELLKYGLGALGGSGLTIIYYQSKNRNAD